MPTTLPSPAAAPVPSPARGIPAWLLTVVKVAFSAGLLWLLFSRIDIARFWSVARASSLPWLLAALAWYVATVVLSSWRWHRLLLIQGVRISLGAVLESFLVSLFFNNFLPTNIGGDVMRVRDTAKPAGSPTKAMTVIVADRLAGLMALFLFAAVGGAVMARTELSMSVGWIWATLAAGILGSLLALAMPSLLTRCLDPFPGLKQSWVGRQVEALAAALLNFRAAPGALAAVLVSSVVIQATFVLLYVAVARALGVHVGFFEMAFIVPMAGLIQLLPVSVNGFGIREATFTVLFGRVGVGGESALLISLEATAIILACSLSGAVAYVLRRQAPADATTAEGELAQRTVMS